MNNFALNLMEAIGSLAARDPDLDNFRQVVEQLTGEQWQRGPRFGDSNLSGRNPVSRDGTAQNSLHQGMNILIFQNLSPCLHHISMTPCSMLLFSVSK